MYSLKHLKYPNHCRFICDFLDLISNTVIKFIAVIGGGNDKLYFVLTNPMTAIPTIKDHLLDIVAVVVVFGFFLTIADIFWLLI
jgi:hypothetical protein